MPGDRFYWSQAWRNVRKEMLARYPQCMNLGCKAPATHVDHHIPRKTGIDPFLRSNLRCYCHPCHSRKTARYDGGLGNRVSAYRPDPGVNVEGLPLVESAWSGLRILPGPTKLPLGFMKPSKPKAD